jgi:ElaB/YqjD/DUF883 family membrane-anchored ribosome-binding protein
MENEFYTGTQNQGLSTEQSSSSVADRSQHMSSQINEKVDSLAENLKSKTNQAVESTSRGIDRMTMYFKEKDSQAMMEDLQQLVRKHPGKSLVSGVVLGVLLGKILR